MARIYYVCHCAGEVVANKGKFYINRNIGPIKYSQGVLGNSNFPSMCSESVVRTLCQKACIVLLTLDYSDPNDVYYDVLSEGVNYACAMSTYEYNTLAGKFRYLLELATVFNLFIDETNEKPNFPQFYNFTSPMYFSNIDTFGELSPISSTNEFYEHITIVPKIEDKTIRITDNNLYYVPIVSSVKKAASDSVRECINHQLPQAKGVKDIFNSFITATIYELDYKSATFVSTPPCPSYESIQKAIESMKEIPNDLRSVGRALFRGPFNLYGVFKIHTPSGDVIKNILISRH
jgi:hypothetical protein